MENFVVLYTFHSKVSEYFKHKLYDLLDLSPLIAWIFLISKSEHHVPKSTLKFSLQDQAPAVKFRHQFVSKITLFLALRMKTKMLNFKKNRLSMPHTIPTTDPTSHRRSFHRCWPSRPSTSSSTAWPRRRASSGTRWETLGSFRRTNGRDILHPSGPRSVMATAWLGE